MSSAAIIREPMPEDLYAAIGAILRLKREQLDLSQEEVASAAGVYKKGVSRAERGELDKLKYYVPISWALGLRFAQVISKAEAIIVEDDHLDEWHAEIKQLLDERGARLGLQ